WGRSCRLPVGKAGGIIGSSRPLCIPQIARKGTSWGTGLAPHPLAQGHVQPGQIASHNSLALELAEDVVDRRSQRKAVTRHIALRTSSPRPWPTFVTIQLTLKRLARASASAASWNEILDVNLMSYVFCAKAAVPLMRRNKDGAIVRRQAQTGIDIV